MDNREIDHLIAEKVMGWISDGYLWHDMVTGDMCPIDKFGPSTDIQDAWLVVEKLCSGRTDMSLFLEHHYATYWVKFHGDENEWEAEHTSAPMAIALAALKAVGVEVTP